MPELGKMPDQPSWFRRSEHSWCAVLVLLHPERTVRDLAWIELEQGVRLMVMGTFFRGIHSSSSGDAVETLTADVFLSSLRFRGDDGWPQTLTRLQAAMESDEGPAARECDMVFANTYDPRKQSIEPWLYRVLRNLAITHLRGEARRRRGVLRLSDDGEQITDASGVANPSESVDARDWIEHLMRFLPHIPQDRRFRIRFFLLLTCDPALWNRVPEELRCLTESDCLALGLDPADSFPSDSFLMLTTSERQAWIVSSILRSDSREREVKERVQKWKTSGRKYLQEELQRKAPELLP